MSKKQEKAKLVAARLKKREPRTKPYETRYSNCEAYLLTGTKRYRQVAVLGASQTGEPRYLIQHLSGTRRVVDASKLFPAEITIRDCILRRQQLLREIKQRYIEAEHVFDDATRWKPEYAEERESNP